MKVQVQEIIYSIEDVARYLYMKNMNLTQLRLQKYLYFLFGYYGAVHSDERTDRFLFSAKFEAWGSGAVSKEIYDLSQTDRFLSAQLFDETIKKIQENESAKKFIDSLVMEMDMVSQATLMSRNQQDECWKAVYETGKTNIILNSSLIAEYKKRYLEDKVI